MLRHHPTAALFPETATDDDEHGKLSAISCQQSAWYGLLKPIAPSRLNTEADSAAFGESFNLSADR
jgi:hypothetical protein